MKALTTPCKYLLRALMCVALMMSFGFGLAQSAAAQTLNRFDAQRGPVGALVTLSGANFTGTSSVKFNGTTATFTVNSDTRITTSVPAGASSGAISVTTADGTATSADNFTVTRALNVVAWGDEEFGQTDVPASASSGVVAIAGGGFHSLALKSDGSVVAWGDNDSNQTDVPASASSGVVAIAGGGFHSLALKSDGSVIAWGIDYFGETNVPASASSGVVAIAGGGFHSLALKSDGSVVAWGDNTDGQRIVPASANSDVVAIAAGGFHSLALKSDGSIVAWGNNTSGQTNVPASASSGVVAIAAGDYHSLALKSDGSVIAWGDNTDGNETTGQTDVPASANGGVVAIAAGAYHSVALKSDGSVIAWGDNNFDQLNVPTNASSGVVAIAAGDSHNLALVSPPVPPVATSGAIISEFRTRGANGSTDEYIELYNNTDAPLNISGWRVDFVSSVVPPSIQSVPGKPVFTSPTQSSSIVAKTTIQVQRPSLTSKPIIDLVTILDSSVVIPVNTVIPARGHYLLTGATYSLGDSASGDQTFSADVLDNSGIALRNANNDVQDAVAFLGSTVAGEGTPLSAAPLANGEYAFVRDESSGISQDTDDNATDFLFVSTNAEFYNGLQSQLGSPGPSNLSSPALTPMLNVSGIDPKADIHLSPNRIGSASAGGTNATFGTLTFRRKITNRTGKTITRLRFRFSRLTTLNSSHYNPSATQADLRFLSSSSGTVLSRDRLTTLPFVGTTLETPPDQALGGGVNSSASGFTTVTLPAGLAPGDSENYQFVFGVEKSGGFTAIFNIEALAD